MVMEEEEAEELYNHSTSEDVYHKNITLLMYSINICECQRTPFMKSRLC